MAKKQRVEISSAAQADADAIRDHIALDKPGAAEKWSRRLVQRMFTLRTHPLRHEIIPEAKEINRAYRHFLFGKYRVIYAVEEDRVVVLWPAIEFLIHRL